MTVPQDATFGTFADGGDLAINDIVVGLRNGINTRFNATGFPGIYLPLVGGTMAGAIDMNGNIITGLPAPLSPTDAVNKAYADSLVTSAALTEVNDTNVTLTLGGTPANALLQAVSLTLGWTGQLAVPRGGTGAASFTAYSVLCGGTTSTGTLQNVSDVGTANQVLVSQGAGALPQWASVPGLVPAALTEVNDTNVTLTLGGTPATSLLQAVSLTLGWTGTLSGTRGGTGVNNGASTATYAGNLNFAGAFSTVGAFAVTQTYTAPTNVTFPPSGTLATTSQLPTPAALTEVNDTNVTLTLGGTPATSLLQAVSLTLGWTGNLSVARGGTGLAAITAHYLPIGNGTSALTLLAPNATSGIPLISQGASADPAYGTAVVSGGGTGNTTFTAYSVLCAGTTATGAFQNVSDVGSSGEVLTSNGAAALPTWQPVSGSGTVNSGTINQLGWYAATGTAVSGLATANNGMLVTNSSGVPSISSTVPAFTTSSITFSPTTGGLVGTTTNDNTAAGKVGEYISSQIVQASATSISNATPTSLTSISLTAGDWDVGGNITFLGSASILSLAEVGISNSNNNQPDGSLVTIISAGASLNQNVGLSAPIQRFSLSGTTTIYIVGTASFATGTCTQAGFLWARRRR